MAGAARALRARGLRPPPAVHTAPHGARGCGLDEVRRPAACGRRDVGSPPILREDTPIKLVFVVADIAAARASAAERGGSVNPVEHEWLFEGAKVCDGHDPEGNVFQLRSADLLAVPGC